MSIVNTLSKVITHFKTIDIESGNHRYTEILIHPKDYYTLEREIDKISSLSFKYSLYTLQKFMGILITGDTTFAREGIIWIGKRSAFGEMNFKRIEFNKWC